MLQHLYPTLEGYCKYDARLLVLKNLLNYAK